MLGLSSSCMLLFEQINLERLSFSNNWAPQLFFGYVENNPELVGCFTRFFCCCKIKHSLASTFCLKVVDTCRMILNEVFSMFVNLSFCSNMRLEPKATLQYSARLLTNKQYISTKSSIDTPAYLKWTQ